jgi:hypothetical protein
MLSQFYIWYLDVVILLKRCRNNIARVFYRVLLKIKTGR